MDPGHDPISDVAVPGMVVAVVPLTRSAPCCRARRRRPARQRSGWPPVAEVRRDAQPVQEVLVWTGPAPLWLVAKTVTDKARRRTRLYGTPCVSTPGVKHPRSALNAA